MQSVLNHLIPPLPTLSLYINIDIHISISSFFFIAIYIRSIVDWFIRLFNLSHLTNYCMLRDCLFEYLLLFVCIKCVFLFLNINYYIASRNGNTKFPVNVLFYLLIVSSFFAQLKRIRIV